MLASETPYRLTLPAGSAAPTATSIVVLALRSPSETVTVRVAVPAPTGVTSTDRTSAAPLVVPVATVGSLLVTVTVSAAGALSASATVTVRGAGGFHGSPSVRASGSSGVGVTVGAVFVGATSWTVTVAVRLSAEPAEFVTRTQYDVVPVSAGVVKEEESVPTGVDVSPACPWYHWYDSGAVPVAATVSVALPPAGTAVSAGCVVIVGATAAAGAVGARATPRKAVFAGEVASVVPVPAKRAFDAAVSVTATRAGAVADVVATRRTLPSGWTAPVSPRADDAAGRKEPCGAHVVPSKEYLRMPPVVAVSSAT